LNIFVCSVLAQYGGIVVFRSQSIPFIRHGKLDYVLLNSLLPILQASTKMTSRLRRRAVPAESHEIDYLRLVQFYQRKHWRDDSIIINEEQLLLNINEVQKYLNENDLAIIDMLLTEYQQTEYKKMRKQIKTTENISSRKPTKRKASSTMTELQNTTTTTR
jgi:hypothetical protein